jgi:hypothetical protein
MTSIADSGRAARRRKLATLALGPLALVPVGLLLVLLFGRYDGADIGHLQSIPYFLQGSTNHGGSLAFAVSTAAYWTFGAIAALYLTLKLAEQVPGPSFGSDLKRAARLLAPQLVLFLVGGPVLSFAYDGKVTPNDFRNIFLLVLLLGLATVAGVVALYRRPLRLEVRLALAPLLFVAWLLVGIDGNTAKAGQALNAGVDPAWQPRSPLHAVMLSWHRLCDGLLGDVGP